MAQLKQISVRNRLLQALAAEDFTLIEPQLERIALPKGKALIEPQQPAEHVTFVETGIASVVALASEDRRVEVGIVGREGCVGHSVVLGVDRTPHQSFIQVEGHGYCIASSHLTRAIEESRTLHGLCCATCRLSTFRSPRLPPRMARAFWANASPAGCSCATTA
jgi:CRP-like cAMP-binding protein